MVGRKDEHSDPVNGNLLLTTLFGADVHLVESNEERQAILDKLRADGHKVYNTSSDGYLLRSVSYVDGYLELRDQLHSLGVIEFDSSVRSPVNHLELHAIGDSRRLVGSLQFVRLIDGNLRILVSVNQEQRRIVCVDVKHRTGQFC